MQLLKRRGVRQFIKFAVVGFLSTIIDWGTYLLLTRYAATFYLTAKVLSFSVSVINSYVLNRRWTFRSTEPKRLHQFSKFLIVAVVGLGLNTLIMYVAVSCFEFSDLIGLVLATIIVVFWNFLANKFYTFKNSQA